MRRGGGGWPGREGREQEVRDAEPNREGKLKRERRAGKSDGNRQQGAWAAWGGRWQARAQGPPVPVAVATGTCVHAARGPRRDSGDGSGWVGLFFVFQRVWLVWLASAWRSGWWILLAAGFFFPDQEGIRGGCILDGAEKLLFDAQLLMADDGHSLD